MSDHSSEAPRRRRFSPLLIIAGLAGAVVLSLSMTNTFSAFTASINNSVNTAASGTLILQEVNTGTGGATCTSTDGGTINTNASTCATINKYGGSTTLVPTNGLGTTSLSTTNLSFKNLGTGTAQTFTLVGGTCTQSNNGSTNGTANDFCGKLNVAITSGATNIYTGTASGLVGASKPVPVPAPAPGGAAVLVTVVVSIDNSAGNTYQGLAASQPLTWTLSS